MGNGETNNGEMIGGDAPEKVKEQKRKPSGVRKFGEKFQKFILTK